MRCRHAGRLRLISCMLAGFLGTAYPEVVFLWCLCCRAALLQRDTAALAQLMDTNFNLRRCACSSVPHASAHSACCAAPIICAATVIVSAVKNYGNIMLVLLLFWGQERRTASRNTTQKH
jgi:hypothetical protein